MINIAEKEIKFNDLEENLWKQKMEEGLEELKTKLRQIDDLLLKHKDNNKLKVKDFCKTTIKCRFGDLEIYRRRYICTENKETKTVYLLDIYLELGYIGQYSQSIVEMVLREVTDKSYRSTAKTISEDTNTIISYTAARNIVLKFAEKIEETEKLKLKLYQRGELEGERVCSIVYSESDGVYIHKQNRKKNKLARKGKRIISEVKIGVIHEGFEKRYNKDCKLVNKQMVVTTRSATYFKSLVDMIIGTTYQESSIEKIIINADGAGWTKNIAEGVKERYQLDMAHIQRAIYKAVKNEEYRKMMQWIVYTKNPEDIFHVIHNYKLELEYDERVVELKQVLDLEEYLRNNEKGLLRYQYDFEDKKEELKNLGTEESQVYIGCVKRMKKNRTSWSDIGAEAMVKVINYTINKEIQDIITGKMKEKIQEELSKRIEEPKKVKKIKQGKLIYAGKHQIASNFTGRTKEYVLDVLRGKKCSELMLMG